MFTGEAEEPIVFTRISLIRFDERMKEIEISIDNEVMQEPEVYCISDNPPENSHEEAAFDVKSMRRVLSYPSMNSDGYKSAGNSVFPGDDESKDLSGVFDQNEICSSTAQEEALSDPSRVHDDYTSTGNSVFLGDSDCNDDLSRDFELGGDSCLSSRSPSFDPSASVAENDSASNNVVTNNARRKWYTGYS